MTTLSTTTTSGTTCSSLYAEAPSPCSQPRAAALVALQVRLSHHEPGRTPLQSALEHEIENAVQRMQINFFPVGQALGLNEMFSLDELREEVNELLNEDEAGGDYDGGGLL